jgi:hypothetical protein
MTYRFMCIIVLFTCIAIFSFSNSILKASIFDTSRLHTTMQVCVEKTMLVLPSAPVMLFILCILLGKTDASTKIRSRP